MRVIKQLWRSLFVLVGLFCLSQTTLANATNNRTDTENRFDTIEVQSRGSSLSTTINVKGVNAELGALTSATGNTNLAGTVSIDKLLPSDYGAGLLRTIFGDFKEAFCFDGTNNCVDNSLTNTSVSGEQSLYANIFLPQTQLSKMYSAALNMALLFSLAMIAFLVFFGFFYAVIHTASTASQRSLNNLYTDVFFHFRWAAVLIAVFPTSSNYSLGMLGMMKLMGYSNTMANVVYAHAIQSINPETFTSRLKTTIQDKISSTSDNSLLMRNLFMSAYCLKQMNDNPSTGVVYGTVLGIKDNEMTLNFGPTWGNKTNGRLWGSSYDAITPEGSAFGMDVSFIGSDSNNINAGRGQGALIVGKTMFNNDVNISEYAQKLTNRSPTYCGSISLPLIVLKDGNFIKEGFVETAKQVYKAVFGSTEKTEVEIAQNNAQQKNRYSWAQLQGVLAATAKAYDFITAETSQDKDKNGRTSILGNQSYLGINKTLIEMEIAYFNALKKAFEDSSVVAGNIQDANYSKMFVYNINNEALQSLVKGDTFKNDSSITHNTAKAHTEAMIEANIAQRLDKLNGTCTSNSSGESRCNTNLVSSLKSSIEKLINTALADDSGDLLYRVSKQAIENGWVSAGANFNALIGISSGYNVFDDFAPSYSSPSFFNDTTEKDGKDAANANVNDGSRLDIVDYNRVLLAMDPTGFESYTSPLLQSKVVGDLKNGKALKDEDNPELKETYLTHLKSANYRGISFANMMGYNPYRDKNELLNYKHPLLYMKQRGETMIQFSSMVFLANAGVSIANTAINGSNKNDPAKQQDAMTQLSNTINANNSSSKFGGFSGVTSMLTELAVKAQGISMPIAWILLLVGSIFSIYLPLLPTLYWIFGVLTWMLSFIVNMVALPVAAFGMLMARGQDFLGRAIAFMLMFIETNLRPTLMVVGLFATALMSSTFMDLAVRLFDMAYMNTSPSDNILSSLIYGFIRCYFEYQILVICCSLIITIPQRVIAHIQGSAAVEDSSESQSNRLMGAITTGRMQLNGIMSGMNGAK